jgi:GTP-binding protein
MIEALPLAAIIGRPNVGKSTLFNRLIKQRKAIVGDRPGVTVDRVEALWKLPSRQLLLVDTGGIGAQACELQTAIDMQVEAALEVADVVLFVVDGRSGPMPVDQAIADKLRRQNMPALLVVNKAEKPDTALEFFALGMGDPMPVSAAHGHGIRELCERVEAIIPPAEPAAKGEPPLARIAVVGRPNAGKSTLINAWLGRERMVVSAVAGTTRDAVDADLQYGDGVVRLIDTAGIRKHGRISDVIEFVAVTKARQAMARAEAAVVLLDCSQTVAEQDLRLMSLAQDAGCALVVGANKVDAMSEDGWDHFRDRLDFRMRGLPDVPVRRISALRGKGLKGLLKEAVKAAERNRFEIGTGELNRWLQQAQRAQPAPSADGQAVRLKYCTMASTSPPTLRIFCNRPKQLKTSYRRYLEREFRNVFKLPGVPVRLNFTASDNPYASGGKRA